MDKTVDFLWRNTICSVKHKELTQILVSFGECGKKMIRMRSTDATAKKSKLKKVSSDGVLALL